LKDDTKHLREKSKYWRRLSSKERRNIKGEEVLLVKSNL